MHELSITQSVVDAVAEHTDGAPVASVHLRIGKLSGVVPDALRFCEARTGGVDASTMAQVVSGIDQTRATIAALDTRLQEMSRR